MRRASVFLFLVALSVSCTPSGPRQSVEPGPARLSGTDASEEQVVQYVKGPDFNPEVGPLHLENAGPKTVELLQKLYQEGSAEERARVVGLATLTGKEDLHPMIEGHAANSGEAFGALYSFRDPKFEEFVLSFLFSEDLEMAQAAARGAKRFNTKKSRDELARACIRSPHSKDLQKTVKEIWPEVLEPSK